ncbi:uncharacterized protein BJ171DRAFT_460569 [Polychytrium aggregatum]|uniref:uncharacterized protein n=1 Tax=Polychytrium aggregatum TaxID=110093 RepID=UPI0022FE1064|nr:uncharacterized protein BJ171DRAFT_460569 [Polychytrium aggregatum]KAI9203111.1 hypothetical protein BJ171DRAFT_460569 [Polychytrium aggregatum]
MEQPSVTGARFVQSPTLPAAIQCSAALSSPQSHVQTPLFSPALTSPRSLLIFSGGSALNPLVGMIQNLTDDVAYILPVSDDGGSTAEIIKVLGGPAIGDIRSRLVRLAETKSAEARAVHKLLSHRLPTDSTQRAKLEWHAIVEGQHALWEGISEAYRESIRSFLSFFNYEIIRRAGRHSFDFRGGSIGNFFLSGCRIFFHSLEAAIFQFARIMRTPARTDVVPILTSIDSTQIRIAAELRSGAVIYGQCQISHPGSNIGEVLTRRNSLATPTASQSSTPVGSTLPHPPRSTLLKVMNMSMPISASSSTSVSPSTSAVGLSQNLLFSKTECPPLASPIRRVYYFNNERQEILPPINPLIHKQFQLKRTLVYAMGSLWTSIIPCLIVAGVGRLIASDPPITEMPPRPKVLLLNGSTDRETEGYTAMDFVLAITDALNYSFRAEKEQRAARQGQTDGTPRSTFRSAPPMETVQENLVKLRAEMESRDGRKYCTAPYPPSTYITHLVYLEDGSVPIDIEAITALGITCLKVQAGPESEYFDPECLRVVLDQIVQ